MKPRLDRWVHMFGKVPLKKKTKPNKHKKKKKKQNLL